jgi:hypothetical protein
MTRGERTKERHTNVAVARANFEMELKESDFKFLRYVASTRAFM